jgi:lipase chaperone LimK
MSGVVPAPPAAAITPEPAREPGLALDSGGHLVAGMALRRLMDSYLAGGAAGRPVRARQLQDFLHRHLAPPAAAEGVRIAGRYSQYLDTQERLLARERFDALAMQPLAERDVERLLAYREQRAQLRERVLGATLARAWFEADDSRCGAALREWQLQHVAPEPGQELDPMEIRERRIHGAALEARRNEDAQVCAAQMILADGGG